MKIEYLMLILFCIIIFLIILNTKNLRSYKEYFGTNIEDDIDCYVVSMNDKERLKNIEEQQKKINFKINIYNAFDGKQLKSSNYKNELKEKNLLNESGPHFKLEEKKRNNEIGCALSHTGIYKMIQDKKKNKNYNKKYTLIFEDDISLFDNFLEKFKKGLESIKDKKFDMLYLGRTWANPGNKFNDLIHKYKDEEVYGTFAYLVNNDSIDKLVEETKQINDPIDCMLSKLIKDNKIEMYYFYPNIAYVTESQSIIHENFFYDNNYEN